MSNVIVSEYKLRKVVHSATDCIIPAGRVTDLRPNFPPETAVLANKSEPSRHADSCDRDLIYPMCGKSKKLSPTETKETRQPRSLIAQ